MEILKTATAIIAICAGLYQSSMGCGEIIQYGEYRRKIQSPNFGAEYGKAANCSWEFQNIDTRYALQLRLNTMRMYYYDVNGDKICGDSYRLVINGERVDCMLDISPGHGIKFYSFYSNPSCTNVECGHYCKNMIKIDLTSIRVEYIADGSRPIIAPPREMYGFQISYEYVKCPGATETVGTNADITSALPTSLQETTTPNPTVTTAPTRARTKSMAPSTKATTTTTATTAPTIRSPATSPTTTRSALLTTRPSTQTTPLTAMIQTTNLHPQPKSNNRLPVSSTSHGVASNSGAPINNQGDSKPDNLLLYGLIGGGVGLVILIVIIIFIVRKRDRENKTGKSGSGDDESGHCMTENALYETSGDLDDDAGHASVDPAVVYTAVDKSAKSQKTEVSQYVEVGEDDQSHDTGHAPLNTPVACAIVNKSSKFAETEAPTYARVDKSAKLTDEDNNQSEPASDATPTTKPPVYATVEINDSGTKTTVH